MVTKCTTSKGLGFILIGLTQTMHRGKYVWIKTGEEPNYTNWTPGQPEGSAAELCIGVKANAGTWDDVPCSTQYYFVCEKEGKI